MPVYKIEGVVKRYYFSAMISRIVRGTTNDRPWQQPNSRLVALPHKWNCGFCTCRIPRLPGPMA